MKIGAAIIACDRLPYTKRCFEATLANSRDLNELFILNDGKHLDPKDVDLVKPVEVINNEPPYQTVGKAKNRALKTLLARGCEHIFLIENDILPKTPEVFKRYIEVSQATGIEHLNFGYHGPANRSQTDYNQIAPRYIVEYPGGIKVALNPHSVGAFSYFTKNFIEKVGYHDDYFRNAWEHVDLCQRAITKGLLPAFWWFPDVADSHLMLDEIAESIQNSSITHTPEWIKNMHRGGEFYKKRHGHTPIQSPDTPLEKVLENLKTIYSQRKK